LLRIASASSGGAVAAPAAQAAHGECTIAFDLPDEAWTNDPASVQFQWHFSTGCGMTTSGFHEVVRSWASGTLWGCQGSLGCLYNAGQSTDFEDGIYSIQSRVCYSAFLSLCLGGYTPWYDSPAIGVDTVAPDVEIIFSTAQGLGALSVVLVVVHATDGLSGLASVDLLLDGDIVDSAGTDGAQILRYIGTEEGTFTVRATDNAGNTTEVEL
jgi:hypothetical protein